MEKRGTIICLILVAVIVVGSALTIILSGTTAGDYNYVQLEINPRVEFICDKKFKVVSVAPLNDDARIVLTGLDLIDKDIKQASSIFLDECAKTGYIDVNGVDNATNVTVVDGLTQALDVHVMQSIYKYFKDNEIMASVTETYEDRKMFDGKKENDVCCVNKFKLATTISEVRKDSDFQTLKKMNEVTLIDIVVDNHKNSPFTPTEEEIAIKQTLIEKNKNIYDTHKKAITKNTQREFSKLFEDFQKSSIKEYQQDFVKQYTIWQENRV